MKPASSSIHYAGGFQTGVADVHAGKNGEIMPRVHLIDSSIFPASPAQPLTFTIMANAMRIVSEVMSG